ncbi:MAG TPA: hypothetical protein PKE66_15085 [Pyrinomonadaceae bacterium]|nr:hypothetical protein [Pyrinomonadaceae bacterium]
MTGAAEIRNAIGDSWIPQIYADRVRPLRTRAFEMDIAERESSPEIMDTLLGCELKAGRVRVACPTRPVARYLAVFARLGCRKVAVPYDITQIPELADEFERAWALAEKHLALAAAGLSPQSAGRLRAALIREMRTEIAKIGSGEMMPLFDTSTKQRKD